MTFAYTMYGAARKIAVAIVSQPGVCRLNATHRRRVAGFSLVEVVLALGIVAFAFLPLLGLMPIGLSTSRQAIDTTIQAQIIQQMTSLAQQTSFSTLSNLTTNPMSLSQSDPNYDSTDHMVYFDANGNITTKALAIYEASFGAPVNTVLPGGSTTQKLSTLTIYILSTRTANAATTHDLSTNSAAKKYILFVADNGL